MKIDLITGGSGFFGTNLAFKLLEKGRKVRIFDLVEPVLELKDKVEFIRGDILNYQKVKIACEDIDTVYHTIALVPLSKAGIRFKEVNIKGTWNIIRCSVFSNVRKYVHISSSAVYDLDKMPITEESKINPLGDYGNTKYTAEFYIKSFDYCDWTIIRPRTILGPYRAGIFDILFDWVYRGKTIPILGNGNNKFQLISASDLAEACYLASKKKKTSREIINIGNEKYGTLEQLIESLILWTGSKSKIKYINPALGKLALRILDKLKLSPLADWHYETLDKDFYFDISKAKKLLRWKPKDSNDDMIRESYDWWLENRKSLKTGTTHRTSPAQALLKYI